MSVNYMCMKYMYNVVVNPYSIFHEEEINVKYNKIIKIICLDSPITSPKLDMLFGEEGCSKCFIPLCQRNKFYYWYCQSKPD